MGVRILILRRLDLILLLQAFPITVEISLVTMLHHSLPVKIGPTRAATAVYSLILHGVRGVKTFCHLGGTMCKFLMRRLIVLLSSSARTAGRRMAVPGQRPSLNGVQTTD